MAVVQVEFVTDPEFEVDPELRKLALDAGLIVHRFDGDSYQFCPRTGDHCCWVLMPFREISAESYASRYFEAIHYSIAEYRRDKEKSIDASLLRVGRLPSASPPKK